jgi:hypothetical protein
MLAGLLAIRIQWCGSLRLITPATERETRWMNGIHEKMRARGKAVMAGRQKRT